MIVRRRADGSFVAIAQHDHALVSGAFAQQWRLGGTPGSIARFAIAYHDVAWVGLDATVQWNADADAPYTFLDLPLEQKYRAYRASLDLLDAGSPYAGWLCSRHFGHFAAAMDDPLSAAFLAGEQQRQSGLWPRLTEAEREASSFELPLLQFCDALSLFVCSNEPGRTTWSWYPDGIGFRGTQIRPRWVGPTTVALDPDPFDAPVAVHFPYRIVDHRGAVVDAGVQELTVGGR